MTGGQTTIKIGNLESIAWHLEQGRDNGNITREALALFLRGVADELKAVQNEIHLADQDRLTLVQHVADSSRNEFMVRKALEVLERCKNGAS